MKNYDGDKDGDKGEKKRGENMRDERSHMMHHIIVLLFLVMRVNL